MENIYTYNFKKERRKKGKKGGKKEHISESILVTDMANNGLHHIIIVSLNSYSGFFVQIGSLFLLRLQYSE